MSAPPSVDGLIAGGARRPRSGVPLPRPAVPSSPNCRHRRPHRTYNAAMSHEETERLEVSTDDGRTLEGLVTGPREGTVLVFHSGTPFGLVPLPSGLDPAGMGIRTLLYARPGYGRSSPQPGRSVADAASDTAAILDALEVERFINLGWSGGGPAALACDALLADRCLATAVIAGIAPYTEADTPSEVRS
jgi:pimeloyl-ACP methyl ester carboxylesterase